MAEGAGQAVDFSVLVRKAAEASISGLKELCETSSELSDTEKKIGLLKYIVKTRQRLLRLVALTKWCRQMPLVEQCQQLAGTLSNHDMSFTQAADFLFYLHETLQNTRAPVYDILTAAETLVTGSYDRLPKCIDDLGMQPVLIGEEREAAVKKLNAVLRTCLLDIALPKQITDIKVTGGRVIFKVAGEFEAHLTLGYRGHLSYWRVLKIDILVGESSGPIQFTDPQAYFLGDELERRMAASEDSLGLMYSILHQFCTALVMDTLFRQIKVLQSGRWRDSIKYEKLSDSGGGTTTAGMAQAQPAGSIGDMDMEPGGATKIRGSPGLKIVYWLETQKGEPNPSLRIEHGSDQQITCSHFPAVIDSSTGMEAQFVVDSSCINVEKLLLRAIGCSIHTRLLEVQRGLKGAVHLWQSDNDVILKHSIPAELECSNETITEGEDLEEAGEEALCVRAFGSSYMALGISIRNGRFLLRCPSTVLAASMIKEVEDVLNLGTLPPLDAFVSLRTKCLLHYFGLIGRSLNLKLYERGAAAVKLPLGGPKLGVDVLIMGFPHCDDSLFLCLQLDVNFTPLFTLLESQPQPSASSGKTTLESSAFEIIRWMKIDIETKPILRGNTGFSLLELSGYEAKASPANTSVRRIEDEAYGKFTAPPMTRGYQQGYHQGKSLGGSPTIGDGSRRLGLQGMMNGVSSPHNMPGVSPLRNSNDIRNQMPHRKSALQSASDQELMLNRRSPVAAMGDNAASPIELDDEHISKLIDSISSKTPGSFATMDSPSRQGRHSIPQPRSAITTSNSRPLVGRVGSPSGSQLARSSGLAQANSPGWKSTLSPAPYNTDSRSSIQEWTDGEQQGRLGGSSDKLLAQRSKRKRSIADLFSSLSSLQALSTTDERMKRRRTTRLEVVPGATSIQHVPNSTTTPVSQRGLLQSYGHIIRAANQGRASAGAYRAVFQQVEERCRLCIKHARLSRQMDAQGIPYVNEVGLREPSIVLRFRLPATVPTGDSRTRQLEIDDDSFGWQQMSLSLGKPGSEGWEVKVLDTYFSGLWKLQKQCEGSIAGAGAQFASPAQYDSHMQCTHEGLVLKYSTVQDDSVTKLVTDLERIWRARAFSLGIRKLLGPKEDEKKRSNEQWSKGQSRPGDVAEVGEKKWEVLRRAFRVDAVGLTSVSFTFVGSMAGSVARFVVEWGTTRRGCTVHSPEQLWPHTKYLEEYINGGEVELLLDAIQVTAGPLQALVAAIRPPRMAVPSSGSNNKAVPGTPQGGAPANTQGRPPGPGLVPSSLLPTDVSVLLRSAYWVRIVYRREFAIDMRCFAGDQVWLQPAPPPQSSGANGNAGGSLPCPQFRTFVVDHVTLGMNSADTVGVGAAGPVGSNSPNTAANNGSRQAGRPGNNIGSNNTTAAAQGNATVSGAIRMAAAGSISIRGELNPALVGMGDDGGYGGAWVPLAALKKVLRGTLRYLGGLWLFAQFPNILKEVLASTLNPTEGALLNHDPEQPALRFFIRGCVFAVSMHRQQLFLQAINVKRYQQQQAHSAAHHQAGAPGQVANLASELSQQEMQEIGDFFARRVASEPYDSSRLASFVTMLTLPVPVLREFLVLIQWKKETSKASGGPHGVAGDATGQGASPRPRVELSLESPVGTAGGESGNKSSIQHNQHRSSVEFTLTFSFDASQTRVNVVGGAGWLPQSVALRLVYMYGEGSNRIISLAKMDGSHGGRSCWAARPEEWERCHDRVAQAVNVKPGEGPGQRLRALAEAVQMALQNALMQIGKGA